MTALAVMLMLQGGWTRVDVFGGGRDSAEGLARYLGPAYQVQWVLPSRTVTVTNPAPPRRSPGDRSIRVLVPELASTESVDAWVAQLRKSLHEQAARSRKDLFVYVPSSPGEDNRTVSTYLVPLARQIAREEGVGVIELDGAGTFAEAVGDAIVDQRLEKKNWRLVSFDSQQIDEGPAANAIDGDPETYWHTQYDPTSPKHPHEIVVDMGAAQSIAGFRYVPRQDGGVNGRVKGYAFYVSEDGKTWGEPVLSGDLPNTSKATRLRFDKPVRARYFRFVATSEINRGPWTTAAEIDVLRARP